MSNSTDTTGCISHRRHTRFFVMHEDFLDVAKISEHQYKLAAFWRVLETKTNDRVTSIPEIAEGCKKKGIPIPEEHLWIEIPYSEFVNRSLGTYKYSSFQIASAESERLGFSKSRQLKRPINPNDPNSPLEDYKEYLFLSDVMQSVLNGGEYPPPIEINSPLLKSIAARKEAKKERRAIEKNTPPIEINSPPTVPPIEINSPPLLKSIGNKYIGKNSKDNRKIVVGQQQENIEATTPSQEPTTAAKNNNNNNNNKKDESSSTPPPTTVREEKDSFPLPSYSPETKQLTNEITNILHLPVSDHLLRIVDTHQSNPALDLKMIASEAFDYINSRRNKTKKEMSADFFKYSIEYQLSHPNPTTVESTGASCNQGTRKPVKRFPTISQYPSNNLLECYLIAHPEEREQIEEAMKGSKS